MSNEAPKKYGIPEPKAWYEPASPQPDRAAALREKNPYQHKRKTERVCTAIGEAYDGDWDTVETDECVDACPACAWDKCCDAAALLPPGGLTAEEAKLAIAALEYWPPSSLDFRAIPPAVKKANALIAKLAALATAGETPAEKEVK